MAKRFLPLGLLPAAAEGARDAAAAFIYPRLWEHLREILIAPFAPDALHAMHSRGRAGSALPGIRRDRLSVIRDFYHHYTVDAHSIMAIEYIHRLGSRASRVGASRSLRSFP